MEIGFGIPVSGSWATPAGIREICRRAEDLGYSSLWSFQRTLYPADASIPVVYRSVHDPLAVSAYVAAVTERARIGLAVVNLPFYAPLVLSKALTSIDVLSDGRLDVGLGLGWNPDEFTAAGADITERGARAEEFVEALRATWGPDPVSHKGKHYEIPPGIVEPKPVQQPGPPVLLGANAEPALRRAGRIADGWISSSRFPAEQVPAAIESVRAGREEAGRDDPIRVVVRGVVRLRDEDDPEHALTGTVDHVRRGIAEYAAQGVTELFVDLNFDEQVGDPAADPAVTMRRAYEALEALAPQS
jgi:probable F420-dependent oxidoreductase